MSKRTLFLVAAFLTGSSFGAGFGLYEMDAASSAMGGHVFGSPRNASAVYYNPGAMHSLTGTWISVGYTGINPRLDTKVNDRHTSNMDPGWFTFPTFFVTQELPWGFHFGFGGFADFGLGSEYNDRWALKHDSYETLFIGYTLQPVISYDITDKWSFGIGPRFTFVEFETHMMRDFQFVDDMYMAQSMGYLHAPVRGKNRLKLRADNRNHIGIGLAAGTQYRFTDDISVGVMYRSRVKTKLRGDAKWRGEDLGHSNPAGDSVQLPASVAVGFNWDNAFWLKGLHFGASGTWIEWSKMSHIVFDIYNPVSRKDEGNRIDLEWRNTYRVGFGFGYDLNDNWEVLCGYVYDWDPCRNRIFDAHTMLPLGDRHVVSGGLAWTSDSGAWEIALTYSCIIMESKTQSIPGEYYQYDRKIYDFHTHNSYTHLVSLGVTYHF